MRGRLSLVGAAVRRRASSGGGGGAFTQRPYLFQHRWAAMQARIAAGDDEWDGPVTASANQPGGFGTIAAAAVAGGGRGTVTPYGGFGGSYNDISAYQIALYAALTNNSTALAIAKSEGLSWIRGEPDGVWGAGTSDSYQRIDDDMLNTCFIVDATYSLWSPSELDEARTYVTGCMANAAYQVNAFWPGEDPHNNYWNNQHYAVAIAAICAEGWGGSALTTWRTRFQTMCQTFVTNYTSPKWRLGQPSITEGLYYAAYRRKSFEALRLSDYYFGTTWVAQCGQTAQNELNAYMHLLRADMNGFFHYGAEANATAANWDFNKMEMAHYCMEWAPSSAEAQFMKSILTTVGPETVQYWGRAQKDICNFLYSKRAVSTVALTTKTDRMLTQLGGDGTSGAPWGGGWTTLRAAAGWNAAAGNANLRSAVVWHGGQPPGLGGGCYSHANPDSPGFQWTQGAGLLVFDPEYNSNSGVEAQAGVPTAALQSNIVVLNSQQEMTYTGQCVPLFIEDNTGGAIPHYYLSINAAPVWTAATTYRRQYVWLDDLQVVLVHDRVVTAGANSKSWLLHVHGTVSIAAGVATVTTARGSYSLRIRDLYATSGGTMTSAVPTGITSPDASMRRITQTDAANDFRSLKVLDVNNRCTAASLSSGAGYLQADMTINGVARSVRFFDDGSHATVS